MTGQSIVSWFSDFTQIGRPLSQLLGSQVTGSRHTLHYWWQHQEALPAFVREASPAGWLASVTPCGGPHRVRGRGATLRGTEDCSQVQVSSPVLCWRSCLRP